MTGVYHRIIKVLMMLSFAVVPLLGFIDCDLGDGEIGFDLHDLGIDIENDELRFNFW